MRVIVFFKLIGILLLNEHPDVMSDVGDNFKK